MKFLKNGTENTVFFEFSENSNRFINESYLNFETRLKNKTEFFLPFRLKTTGFLNQIRYKPYFSFNIYYYENC